MFAEAFLLLLLGRNEARLQSQALCLEFPADGLCAGAALLIDVGPETDASQTAERWVGQVLDRINGVAYVCLSERADAGLAQAWADQLGYQVCPSAP